MTLKGKLESRIRGWFPQEPSLKVTQNVDNKLVDIPKRAITQKHIAVANGLLLGAFLGSHFLIAPFNKNVVVTVGFWSTFLPAVILLNYWLYHISKNRTNPKEAN